MKGTRGWFRSVFPATRAAAFAVGLMMTAGGLITLLVFVGYELLHAGDIAQHVVRLVLAGVSGMALVLLGFALMVLGAPSVDSKESPGGGMSERSSA